MIVFLGKVSSGELVVVRQLFNKHVLGPFRARRLVTTPCILKGLIILLSFTQRYAIAEAIHPCEGKNISRDSIDSITQILLAAVKMQSAIHAGQIRHYFRLHASHRAE